MSGSEDEFGDVDEADLLMAAVAAESVSDPSQNDFPSEQASKRRRLNNYADNTYNEGDDIATIGLVSQATGSQQWHPFIQRPRTSLISEDKLRQTTLKGLHTQAPKSSQPQPQISTRRSWPLVNKDEAPTHHQLNVDELQTWVYPTNLGTTRDYQFNIVARGLYHNLLVALPTGLGKTFIAATVMLNWFRWTKDSQIIFVAPSKPLVAQQVDACFGIAGIPRSATSMLTGEIQPGLRVEEWKSKRVFFMTPQTIVNDLKTGICDPKRIVLVVVDEAHRATGGYAYVEVVKFLRRFNTSFRVLALTATPGSTVESVQQVIDGLGISRVEIRTEESIDIRQYVHSRMIDTVLFEYSEDMKMVMELFSKALQPLVSKLTGMNAYWSRDPMALTPYGCTQARQKWMSSEAGRRAHMGVKGMVNGIFTILASLGHGIELLKYHGIGPFYQKVLEFRTEAESTGERGSKYRRQVIDNADFKTMMTRIQTWIRNKDFLGHPKLEYLQDVVLNHFLDAGEGRSSSEGKAASNTRIMIFAHYRDSAEEIVKVLKRSEPIVKPNVFVGQAHSKGSEGMGQKKQQAVIDNFKNGVFNTLVATSIGEEGLDIGEVDLIICYDASASPIRMLQRMGRTGRKRAGNIVVTLMKGKEENNFVQAKDNYEKMQKMIAEGTKFNFHDDLSPRILPRSIQPVVDKRIVEIPLENSQPELPVPKKRGRVPKMPPKKFHLPDDAVLGFTKASGFNDNFDQQGRGKKKRVPKPRSPSPVDIPTLSSVFLTQEEEARLTDKYQNVEPDAPELVDVPSLKKHPSLQRSLLPTCYVEHGSATKIMVDTLKRVHDINESTVQGLEINLHPKDKGLVDAHWNRRTALKKKDRKRYETVYEEALPDDNSSSIGVPSPSFRQRDSYATNVDPSSLPADSDDDLGSLADFINDDGDQKDKLSSTSTSLDRESLSPALEATSQNSLSQSSFGGELPDLDTLIPTHPKKGSLQSQEELNSVQHGQKRTRRMVVDSESDDD